MGLAPPCPYRRLATLPCLGIEIGPMTLYPRRGPQCNATAALRRLGTVSALCLYATTLGPLRLSAPPPPRCRFLCQSLSCTARVGSVQASPHGQPVYLRPRLSSNAVCPIPPVDLPVTPALLQPVRSTAPLGATATSSPRTLAACLPPSCDWVASAALCPSAALCHPGLCGCGREHEACHRLHGHTVGALLP
jgi:hypothetical protein